MDKRTELNNALKDAQKSKDQLRVDTIRLILAALKDKDIDARTSSKTMGDAEILSLMQGMIKQRQESLDIYTKAGRQELADREAAEIEIIRGFMPKQMSDDEVKKVVEGLMTELKIAEVRDMGRLMAELKTRYAGQMDMAKASGLVKQKLAG